MENNFRSDIKLVSYLKVYASKQNRKLLKTWYATNTVRRTD